jgi:hypothetical protein
MLPAAPSSPVVVVQDEIQALYARRVPGPAAVRVRLSGDPGDVAAVAVVLRQALDLIEVSPPYLNRRDPGVRVYLTALVHQGSEPR